jgi:ferredoxin
MRPQKAYFKISVNREKCDGCGECAKLCPSNWRILDDKKAHAIRIQVEKMDCNILAMQYCPRAAIKIKKVEA